MKWKCFFFQSGWTVHILDMVGNCQGWWIYNRMWWMLYNRNAWYCSPEVHHHQIFLNDHLVRFGKLRLDRKFDFKAGLFSSNLLFESKSWRNFLSNPNCASLYFDFWFSPSPNNHPCVNVSTQQGLVFIYEEFQSFFWRRRIFVWISFAERPFQMERSQTAQYLERFFYKPGKVQRKAFFVLVQKGCLITSTTSETFNRNILLVRFHRFFSILYEVWSD